MKKSKSVLGCQHDRICRVTEISLVFLVIQWRNLKKKKVRYVADPNRLQHLKCDLHFDLLVVSPPVITRLNVAYETTLVLLCSVKWVKHVSLCKPENIRSLKVELCMTSVNILKLLYIHNVLTLREPGGNFLRFC